MEKTKFEVGQDVKATKTDPMPGNDTAPSLELDKDYKIKEITLDKEGNQHLDIGLVSSLNWVTSWETKEELPKGDEIHWCHPSRFELIKQ